MKYLIVLLVGFTLLFVGCAQISSVKNRITDDGAKFIDFYCEQFDPRIRADLRTETNIKAKKGRGEIHCYPTD